MNAATKELEKLNLQGSKLWKVNELRKAQTHQFQGNYNQATNIYAKLSAEIINSNTDHDLLDFIYQHQGKNYYEQGNLEMAIQLIEKAKTIRATKGDHSLLESSNYALKVIKEGDCAK